MTEEVKTDAELLDDEIATLGEELTPLQLKLVQHIIRDSLSQREAYYKAGGKAKSDEVADSSAWEILSHPKVKAYKKALIRKVSLESVMSREEALKKLSDMANTNITDIADYRTVEVETVDGKPAKQGIWFLKDSENLTPEQAASIMSVKASAQGIEIKQHDQKTAIKQLSEMLGWDSAKTINGKLTISMAFDKEDEDA